MNGVIIRVSPQVAHGSNLATTLEEPPLGEQLPYPFECTGTEQQFVGLQCAELSDGAVREAGAYIYSQLVANPDVAQAINQALLTNDRPVPLLLELKGSDAVETLPWEMLYAPAKGKFLALENWPIGRRVRTEAPNAAPGLWEPPLRIAVFLSCLGIPARDEWTSLRTAVEKSPAAVEVLAFVAEPDLRDELVQTPPPWLRVDGIPDSPDALAERIRQHADAGFHIQVMHFFCHGSIEAGPHLELATTSDWGPPVARQSSLTLEPSQIRDLTDATNRPWLVVLNCCLGAAPGDADAEPAPVGAPEGGPPAGESIQAWRQRAATYSLARQLVLNAGFPAVVGMREPVDTPDATTFSMRFYPQLFRTIAELPPGTPTPVDFNWLVVPARRRLADVAGVVRAKSAGARKQWSLPVVYLRHSNFTVTPARSPARPSIGEPEPPAPPQPVPPAAPPEIPPAAKDPQVAAPSLQLLKDILAGLGDDAPEGYRRDLQRLIAFLEGAR